ncbi:MAG TPA: hypothetical protein VKH81_07760 [Candidatus Angelobacter sp.]|nr:hypothetical protein [Candidatus Angelobacter sp.]
MPQPKTVEAIDSITPAMTCNGKAYWTFQFTFWCLLLVPDLFTIPYRTIWNFAWSISSVLLIFLASHLVHRAALRRRWFYLPPGKMIPRLAIVVSGDG